MESVTIRKATENDAETLLYFIKQLAEFEKLTHQVHCTADDIRKFGFTTPPYFEALLVEDHKGINMGFALYFFTFSTFLSRPTLYLEDLFILPQYRGKGLGEALLRHLIDIAVEHECGRMEWSVLDWNTSAIQFYRSLGARPIQGWSLYRLDRQVLQSHQRKDLPDK